MAGAMVGGSWAPFIRPGDGERNVRSVMEPWLSRRARGPRTMPPLGVPMMLPLPIEDCEPRRAMRLV